MCDSNEIENAEIVPKLSEHSRMQINATKAGMENIDKEKINSIIKKHSQKSKFYQKQQMKEIELKKKAEEKLKIYKSLTCQEIQTAQHKADEFIGKAERSRSFERYIVHIDMDAFYANVEIKENPSLADKPMAVGGDAMLSTSNYIARKFGVRAAMPGFIAKELCPDLIIVPCDHAKYAKESAKVMKVISEYDQNYSAASLDEAYLDLTDYLISRQGLDVSERTFPKFHVDINTADTETITFGTSIEDCVLELRHRIYLATKLTASAGISSNLRLAKLCSDVNKPNGQFRLEGNLETIVNFIQVLPIRKINGIGPSTALLLDCYGIKTCKDLFDSRAMIYLLETQNTFEFLMCACLGISGNRIEHDNDRKSLGHETTFSTKLSNNKEEFLKTLQALSEQISIELHEDNLVTNKIHIKIKTTSFEVYTRTKSLSVYTDIAREIYEAAKCLLVKEYNNSRGTLRLRLIGVRVSGLKDSKTETQPVEASPILSDNQNKINRFFKVKSKTDPPEDSTDEESEIFKYSESILQNCPHCDCLIEGNEEFIQQHLDHCLRFAK